ncbi:hypothetical protein KKD52_11555, partial [Myxococcota bacterium]|nr:hypothetical protein [Myxococcota bacterium]MBU1510989.1 hypothetical protein [Myxococcota bacterium]
MFPFRIIFIFALFFGLTLAGCDDSSSSTNNVNNVTNNTNNVTNNVNNVTNNNNQLEIPDWTEATHGKIDPDYDLVFPQEAMQRFEIIVAPEQWAILQQDLDDHLAGTQGGPGIDLGDWEPVFVPCTVRYNGRDWYQVGIRVKGNSSLVATYNMNIEKFSFKLDFD